MLKSMLVLSVLLTLGVHDCQSTDPLLLEYSDYYYDLYYGDYEDYSPDTAGSGKYFHSIVRRLQKMMQKAFLHKMAHPSYCNFGD